MSACPTCRGAKVIRGIGCGGPNAGPFEMLCYDCNGSGQVADERVIWARDGELLRACRERRDLSLREAARWVGVPASEWSAAEHGRVDPSELIGKVQRAAVEKIRKGAGL